jgi:hypothetical protein
MPLTSPDFAWPAKGKPYSRVITEIKDWADRGILVPHEMFRWYHGHIKEILGKLDGTEEWRTALFCSWVETYYLDMVHHHHEAEENIYNPGIIAKGGQLPDKIKTDHAELLASVDKIKEYLVKMKSGDKSAIPELKSFFIKVIDSMENHLAEEEQIYPSACRGCMTQEEETAIVTKIVQGLGLDGNKKMLPPILYVMCIWDGEEQMQKWFEAGPPPPIRMMTQKCWLSDFYDNNLSVIEGLKGSVEFTPKTPQCGLCVVQ